MCYYYTVNTYDFMVSLQPSTMQLHILIKDSHHGWLLTECWSLFCHFWVGQLLDYGKCSMPENWQKMATIYTPMMIMKPLNLFSDRPHQQSEVELCTRCQTTQEVHIYKIVIGLHMALQYIHVHSNTTVEMCGRPQAVTLYPVSLVAPSCPWSFCSKHLQSWERNSKSRMGLQLVWCTN